MRISKDESEAEEVIQDAYVRDYEHLDQFEGRSKFSTWLTKIAIYVKVRLFRARATIRRQVFERVGTASPRAFQFLGERCDRIVHRVLERIAAQL
jgi:RNA polymerase sigma-70 factor (ECF subfamily)